MTKFLALASVVLLMLGTATAMAKSDAENPAGPMTKLENAAPSQIILAENNEIGRSKRAAADDYDPKTNVHYKCVNGKICTMPGRESSTGPTAPPKAVGSQK